MVYKTLLNIYMRRTRAKYHYAIRYVKRMSETLKKQAMARAIFENNRREL